MISSNFFISTACLISFAILRPVDRFSSTKSAYGEPEIYRFVPATILAEISKTFISKRSEERRVGKEGRSRGAPDH